MPLDVVEQDVDGFGPAFQDVDAGLRERARELAFLLDRAAFERYVDRLARALGSVVNVLDPDVIVLGGGVSNVQELYTALPAALPRCVFSDEVRTRIVPPRHGDSSGVRGAAWLWPA